MILHLNDTHDPALTSWVDTANEADTDFPLQNLPFGVFRRLEGPSLAIGVAVGDRILDLAKVLETGSFSASDALRDAAHQPSLNALMALPPAQHSHLRARLSAALSTTASAPLRRRVAPCLEPMSGVMLALPVVIGDYTDFLTSAWHTERHGRFKGLQEPLPRAFFSLPVAYHGRASSIRISGTDAVRPWGQIRSKDGSVRFAPSAAMDFELELAAYVGQGNEQGHRIPVADAGRHLFGYCLMNDWSAKDIQWWEQVLGPFLGKSFMTVVSPWVVTAEALAPFRGELPSRPEGQAPTPEHLATAEGTLDIAMEAWLQTRAMREAGTAPVRLSATTPRHLSWSFEQMVAHHTSNGCNMRTGDLLGSGTVSGEEASAMGCLTEMTAAGTVPLTLPSGERRHWLEDGDEVVLRARATREGFVPLGFGECRSRILPALPPG